MYYDGMYACSVFLGFQKAFDIVNHKILFFKLEHYRIRGILVKLFQNYLINPNQFVEINKKSSDINDLNDAVRLSKVHHFVDDINMLYISNSLKD